MGSEDKKTAKSVNLTPQLEAEICELIKEGNYIETACLVAGIHKSTYYEWIDKAKVSILENKYTEFSDAVKKTQAWSEARDVAIISNASEKYWQAAAWKLERKYPDRWGKQKMEVEHTGKIDSDIKHIPELDRVVIKEALDIVSRSTTS